MPGSYLAGHYSTSGDSADRVADEERGGVSRSGEGSCGPAGGLDTCPARSSRGTTRPAEVRALLDQRDPPPADRVADEERGGVSRSGDGLWGLGCGLDTCPARSSRGTTRPAGQRGTTRPAEQRGTTRPAEPPSADRVADEERGGVSRSGEGSSGLGQRSRHVPGSFLAGHYSTSGNTGHYSTSGTTGHYSTSGNTGHYSTSGRTDTTRPAEPRGTTRPAETLVPAHIQFVGWLLVLQQPTHKLMPIRRRRAAPSRGGRGSCRRRGSRCCCCSSRRRSPPGRGR